MFEFNNFNLTQALLALLSIIASSSVGRDYLIQNGISIVEKVLQVKLKTLNLKIIHTVK